MEFPLHGALSTSVGGLIAIEVSFALGQFAPAEKHIMDAFSLISNRSV